MNAIETVSLTKKYGDITAVKDLSFNVKEGELYSLLGINGAGKTTTIKMLSCLTAPTSGDALIFGNSIKSSPSNIKRLIAVSPQETALAPNLTVEENLTMMSGIFGMSKADARKKTDEIAEELALGDVLKRRAGKLSGGYMRRLSIAMALVSEPKLLFLDEPTLALDVIARRELWELILSLKKKSTIVMTTHYMEEAEALSDRLGVMRDGELVFSGDVGELKSLAGTDSFEEAFVRTVRRTVK